MISFRDYLLLERIVGNTGWVYHRTKNNPENSDIVKYGIKPSSNQSAMYGKGLYCCYDLDQQLKSGMKKYGAYILKGKIDLNGFAILDEDIYRLANPKGDFESHLKKIGTNIEDVKNVLPYTSQIAQGLWKKCKQNGYNGIIFTGETDGKVAVIWNRRNFIPYQYTKDDGKNWERLNPDISSIKRSHDPKYDKDDEVVKFSKLLKEISDKEEIGNLTVPSEYKGIISFKKLKKIGDIYATHVREIDLPNLQESGGILAIGSKKINLPNLQKSGDIDIASAEEINLPNLQGCGVIKAAAVKQINLPKLQYSKSIYVREAIEVNLPLLKHSGSIEAFLAKKINLTQLDSCMDIHFNAAEEIDLPNLMSSHNINLNLVTKINLPKLIMCLGIGATNAEEINAPYLMESSSIHAPNANEINLPKLQKSGYIEATNASKINLPNLKQSNDINSTVAREINLSQLQRSGPINLYGAKKIIIPKKSTLYLVSFPEDCEIIHPEDTPQIKIDENVTFKKYLMLKESLVQIPLDTAYEIFKNEYDKSTGSSWSRDKFMGRARAWEFYGDDNGYVAIRRQRSGLVKLVGMAGENRSKLKGINDLVSMNLPLWGMVSKEIKNIAVRRGMREPNFLERQVLKRSIPPEVLGGAEILEYQKDGGIKLQYPDVGVVVKYLVGTPQYYSKLRELFGDKLKEKILG